MEIYRRVVDVINDITEGEGEELRPILEATADELTAFLVSKEKYERWLNQLPEDTERLLTKRTPNLGSTRSWLSVLRGVIETGIKTGRKEFLQVRKVEVGGDGK